MIHFFQVLTFGFITVLSVSAWSEPIEDDLPPILDYYPTCSYKIIKNTVESDFSNDFESKEIVTKLLNKLKEKAKSVGADGLILLKKNVNEVPSNKSYKYRVSFTAELIKQCKENKSKSSSKYNIQERTFTAYNHQGARPKGLILLGGFSTEVKIQGLNKDKINYPKITNNELSLENGVYGIKLGFSYRQVVDALGEPNIKLTVLKNELIIGYGRRHWFHFQLGKLVKIQNTLSLLSVDTSNKIPLLDFFDGHRWKIKNKLGKNSLLEDVRETLEIDLALNNSNQLVLNGFGNILTLNFIYTKNNINGNKKFTLDSFSIKTKDYKERPILAFDNQLIQNQAIENIYQTLKYNKEINLRELVARLGKPVGSIVLSKGSTLDIYNPHLLVRMKNSDLVKIHLVEEVFISTHKRTFSNTPWVLGKFKQGNSLEQLKIHFPENDNYDDDLMEIEAENYTLSLLFGEDNRQNLLYEAEITLY